MGEVLLATFSIQTTRFGLPVQSVREVLGAQHVRAVPRAPEAVVGLVNLRGRILAVTDVRTRMGMTPVHGAGDVYYVVEHAYGAEVLRVDGAGPVVSVQDFDAVAVPDTTPAAIAARVSGAYQVEGSLVLVVDLRRLLAGEGGY